MYVLYSMNVCTQDGDGGHHNSSHQFSLDGSLSPLDRLPQLMLLTNAASFVRAHSPTTSVCENIQCSLFAVRKSSIATRPQDTAL